MRSRTYLSSFTILFISFIVHVTSDADEDDAYTQDLPPPDFTNISSLNITEEMVFLGDLSVPLEVYRTFFSDTQTRKATLYKEMMWPSGPATSKPTVPYVIDGNDTEFRKVIEEAMNEWRKYTCIKFLPFVKGRHKDHLIYKRHKDQCGSGLGRLAKQPQQVNLARHCANKSYISMTLGLILGFVYEHMRNDRDNYVFVREANILEGWVPQFQKIKSTDFSDRGVQYDYSSVMHQPGTIYSKNGGITLITRDVRYQGLIGRSGGILSHMDKRLANIHYGCVGRWLRSCALHGDPCFNKGYIGPYCKCICPPGTEGNRCQDLQYPYMTQGLFPSCSMDIKEETIIRSPGYPSHIPFDTWCVLRITAPDDHVVSLKFQSFHLERTGPKCTGAFLEIRLKRLFYGPVFCSNAIWPGREFVANGKYMALYLDVRNNQSKGFEASVKFTYNGPPTTPAPYTSSSVPSIRGPSSLFMFILLMASLAASLADFILKE